MSGLNLIHIDDALIVADKPAGLLCVPGRGPDKADCLSARVQAQVADALVVHRLDMATSGLMLLARGAAVQRRLSHAQLHDLVARLAKAMRAAGVKPGDRVAGFVPNLPETVAAMLAVSAIGAVWSSCSPDFGVQGVLDRFGQIAPPALTSAH